MILSRAWYRLRGKLVPARGRNGSIALRPGTLALARAAAAHNGHPLVEVKRIPAPVDHRAAGKAWMDYYQSHAAQLYYAETRPIPIDALKTCHTPVTTDCSGAVTGCFAHAGLPDPNGNAYNGEGYTGTLRAHLPSRRGGLAAAQVLDVVIYGPGAGSHAALVYQPGPDPLMFSHGQSGTTKLFRHSTENAYHGGYYTVHEAL